MTNIVFPTPALQVTDRTRSKRRPKAKPTGRAASPGPIGGRFKDMATVRERVPTNEAERAAPFGSFPVEEYDAGQAIILFGGCGAIVVGPTSPVTAARLRQIAGPDGTFGVVVSRTPKRYPEHAWVMNAGEWEEVEVLSADEDNQCEAAQHAMPVTHIDGKRRIPPQEFTRLMVLGVARITAAGEEPTRPISAGDGFVYKPRLRGYPHPQAAAAAAWEPLCESRDHRLAEGSKVVGRTLTTFCELTDAEARAFAEAAREAETLEEAVADVLDALEESEESEEERIQHTPGPWAVRYAETGVRWPVVIAGDDELNVVCEISESFALTADPGDSERALSEANARLIAAAPDLLARLREAVEIVREMCEEQRGVGMGREAAFLDAASDTFSKVAGEGQGK